MPKSTGAKKAAPPPALMPYVLDEQVGFVLRQVTQRHTALFLERFGDVQLTATQWTALVKLSEKGALSQNLLGRLTAMDVATIKGVIDRLTKRGLTRGRIDETDGRRRLIELTQAGSEIVAASLANAAAVTEETLAPLTSPERAMFLTLLHKLR